MSAEPTVITTVGTLISAPMSSVPGGIVTVRAYIPPWMT